MDKKVIAYKMYEQIIAGKNKDGYDIYRDKILGYYFDKEKAERDKVLYIKWNGAKCDVIIEAIEIIE